MKIELFNEDCEKTLERLEDGSIDLLLQDTPFGITQNDWDKKPDLQRMWFHWERVIKDDGAIIFFATQPFASELIMSRRGLFRYDWVWEKSLGTGFLNAHKMPIRKHEYIIVFYRKLPTYNPQPTNRSEINKERFRGKKMIVKAAKSESSDNYRKGLNDNIGDREYNKDFGLPNSVLAEKCVHNRYGKMHPTQKPVNLMRYLIRTYTNEGETVFDGYSGSGTTAIACIKENRNFIGAELNTEYYDKAQKRINAALAQPSFFAF